MRYIKIPGVVAQSDDYLSILFPNVIDWIDNLKAGDVVEIESDTVDDRLILKKVYAQDVESVKYLAQRLGEIQQERKDENAG